MGIIKRIHRYRRKLLRAWHLYAERTRLIDAQRGLIETQRRGLEVKSQYIAILERAVEVDQLKVRVH